MKTLVGYGVTGHKLQVGQRCAGSKVGKPGRSRRAPPCRALPEPRRTFPRAAHALAREPRRLERGEAWAGDQRRRAGNAPRFRTGSEGKFRACTH